MFFLLFIYTNTDNGNGQIQKIPSEKDKYIFFRHENRTDGLEKQILSEKICGTKAEEDNAQNKDTD